MIRMEVEARNACRILVRKCLRNWKHNVKRCTSGQVVKIRDASNLSSISVVELKGSGTAVLAVKEV
jgi:hypothetical protein